MATGWLRQTRDRPLFPELIWSKPENKKLAGKLLIIGGNLHNVSAPSNAYNQAIKSGAGAVRVIMPDALKKTFAKVLPDCIFSPSTPSGSFAKNSLATWFDEALWADCVLMAGDFGRNSETTVLIESFVNKYKGQLVITHDALDTYTKTPHPAINRANTLIVGSFAQLQKVLTVVPSEQGVLMHSNNLIKNIEILADCSKVISAHLVTKQTDQIIVAINGRVSTTPNTQDIWRIETSSSAAVWWMQNPLKPFEAITTSLID